MNDINEDLILEIRRMPEELISDVLLRLPVKSLGRFKCVSKKWLDLIQSSGFINSHLSVNISKSKNCSILIKYFDDVESKTILTHYNHFSDKNCYGLLGISSIRDVMVSDFSIEKKVIVTQSNGIVCITDYASTFIGLMNPVLNEFQKISVPIDFICPSGFKSLMFGVVFGFDKVIRLVQFYKDISDNITPSDSYIESQVYDLTKHSWRKSIHKHDVIVINVSRIYPRFYRPLPNPNLSPPNLTVFNGILHSCYLHEWKIGEDINDFSIKPSKLIFNILTFNIATESFRVMEFPPELRDYSYDFGSDYSRILLPSIFAVDQTTTIGLVLFTGPEYKTYSPHDRFGSSMDVWIMKEYGVTDSWIKQYSVTSTHLRFGKPLSLWDKDKIFLLTKDSELNCQNLHNGRCHQLKQFQSIDFSSFQVVICNESLVSVDKYFNDSPVFWRRLRLV